MKCRPIPFSGAMVSALLAGAKTQTRRSIRCKPWYQIEERDNGSPWPWMYDADRDADHWLPCPYGAPGDLLWVRESFRLCSEADSTPPRDTDAAYRIWYEADAPHQPGAGKLRPGMFMPRWASRITLAIESLRVERLQSISEADAIAEGVTPKWEPGCSGRLMEALGGFSFRPAASAYADLWESINGNGSWDANPWVWVLQFKRAQP